MWTTTALGTLSKPHSEWIRSVLSGPCGQIGMFGFTIVVILSLSEGLIKNVTFFIINPNWETNKLEL